MGVWLPLALADIAVWLTVIVRMNGDKETRALLKIPDMSQKLREWCLPLTAKALETEERWQRERAEQHRKDSLYDNLMNLANQMGAKVTEQK